MRFVKFTLLGLVGITLAFLSLGFFHTNFQYENQIEINSSVAESYATFLNDSLKSEWLVGYVGNEILSGVALTPGHRVLMTFEQNGQAFEMIEELKGIKENEKFIFDMETELLTGTIEIYFEGNDEKTTMKVYSTMTGSNIFYRSMFYLLKSGLQKQSQMNYDLLKKVIEENRLQVENKLSAVRFQ